jgi:hypothetical protein
MDTLPIRRQVWRILIQGLAIGVVILLSVGDDRGFHGASGAALAWMFSLLVYDLYIYFRAIRARSAPASRG